LARQIRKPWIFHSDGNITPLIDDILALEPSAIHPWQPEALDIYAAKRKYGDRVCLVGNLSIEILARGTPEQNIAETRHLLTHCGRGGGYCFSSANSLPKYIRMENLLAVSSTIRELNKSL
jgi:uroporphyrinogen decarboxylase